WLHRTLFPTLSGKEWLDAVSRACRGLKDGTEVRCSPTFVGERASLTQPEGATFTGIRLDTDGMALTKTTIQALVVQSAENYRRLAAIQRPARTVYTMGGASAVGTAMHAAWPKKHAFRPLTADALRGLVMLAEKA